MMSGGGGSSSGNFARYGSQSQSQSQPSATTAPANTYPSTTPSSSTDPTHLKLPFVSQNPAQQQQQQQQSHQSRYRPQHHLPPSYPVDSSTASTSSSGNLLPSLPGLPVQRSASSRPPYTTQSHQHIQAQAPPPPPPPHDTYMPSAMVDDGSGSYRPPASSMSLAGSASMSQEKSLAATGQSTQTQHHTNYTYPTSSIDHAPPPSSSLPYRSSQSQSMTSPTYGYPLHSPHLPPSHSFQSSTSSGSTSGEHYNTQPSHSQRHRTTAYDHHTPSSSLYPSQPPLHTLPYPSQQYYSHHLPHAQSTHSHTYPSSLPSMSTSGFDPRASSSSSSGLVASTSKLHDLSSSTSSHPHHPPTTGTASYQEWSTEDDDALRKVMSSTPGRSWPEISKKAFPDGKHDKMDCMDRWKILSKPKATKGPWTTEEDQNLTELVQELGPERWVVIASKLKTRSGKQCRERWHNHLDPSIKKGPFTPEEDELIFSLYAKLGSKWAEIAKHLPGRPDNAIKNHFNTSLQRQKRRVRQRDWEEISSQQLASPSRFVPYVRASRNGASPNTPVSALPIVSGQTSLTPSGSFGTSVGSSTGSLSSPNMGRLARGTFSTGSHTGTIDEGAERMSPSSTPDLAASASGMAVPGTQFSPTNNSFELTSISPRHTTSAFSSQTRPQGQLPPPLRTGEASRGYGTTGSSLGASRSAAALAVTFGDAGTAASSSSSASDLAGGPTEERTDSPMLSTSPRRLPLPPSPPSAYFQPQASSQSNASASASASDQGQTLVHVPSYSASTTGDKSFNLPPMLVGPIDYRQSLSGYYYAGQQQVQSGYSPATHSSSQPYHHYQSQAPMPLSLDVHRGESSSGSYSAGQTPTTASYSTSTFQSPISATSSSSFLPPLGTSSQSATTLSSAPSHHYYGYQTTQSQHSTDRQAGSYDHFKAPTSSTWPSSSYTSSDKDKLQSTMSGSSQPRQSLLTGAILQNQGSRPRAGSIASPATKISNLTLNSPTRRTEMLEDTSGSITTKAQADAGASDVTMRGSDDAPAK